MAKRTNPAERHAFLYPIPPMEPPLSSPMKQVVPMEETNLAITDKNGIAITDKNGIALTGK